MTKADKKERKKAKHQLAKAATANLSRDFRLTGTKRQMAVAGRKIADQLFAGRNPHRVIAFGTSEATWQN